MTETSRVTQSTGWKLDRLAAFSDGVIAIAITILVLGLEVPSVHEVPKSELIEFLRDAMHPALGFVISFVVIGTYWMEHYAIFHFLTHATRSFVALNGLFLLCLSFLPFPTGLQAAYRHDELAMALYGVAQILCGLSLAGLWLYASWNRRLIDPRVPTVVMKSMTWRLLMAPAVSLLAIACSFVSITLSRVMFLAIPLLYLSVRVVDPGWQTARSDDADQPRG